MRPPDVAYRAHAHPSVVASFQLRRHAVLMAAAALAALLLTALSPPESAHAVTLDRTGFDNVPAETVKIDYPLVIDDAEFTTTNSNFKIVKDILWQDPSTAVCYAGSTTPNQVIPGSFTLVWRKAGIDGDGDAVDLSLTISNVTSLIGGSNLYVCHSNDALRVAGTCKGETGAAIQSDVLVEVTKSGTATPAAGTMLAAYADIDACHDPPEQITLVSGYGDTVWVTPTNFLSISGNGTVFTATKYDDNTYDSGFVTTASTEGYLVRWQGASCATDIFTPFKLNEQSVTASATAGGTISDPGQTFLRWKESKTYALAADDHFRIKDVLVDGKSVGAVSTYTFNEVTKHHTIEAVFEEVPTYSVSFVDGFGGTLDTQTVEEGSAATAPNDPTHAGWAFAGWDNNFSHVTSDLVITALWEPMIEVEVPTLVACKITNDGSVVAPTGYAIRNLSPVDVKLTAASTSGMPSYGSYQLVDASGGVVLANENGQDALGSPLTIPIDSSASLTWEVGAIKGTQAQDLLTRAMQEPVELCTVKFTFARA